MKITIRSNMDLPPVGRVTVGEAERVYVSEGCGCRGLAMEFDLAGSGGYVTVELDDEAARRLLELAATVLPAQAPEKVRWFKDGEEQKQR